MKDQANQDCAEEDIPIITPVSKVAAVEKQQEIPKKIFNSTTAETPTNADQQPESTSTCQGCGGVQQAENAVEYFGAISCGSGVDNVRDSIEKVSVIEGVISELLRVASWNICQFSIRKTGRKDTLKRIAKIIDEFDIVAIQEVRDEEVLDALIEKYLPEWGYTHSPPSNQSGYIEYLAFMYRLDSVEVVEPGPYFDDEASAFSRQPIACTFQATKLPELKLTLVNVHLPAKSKNALEEVAGFDQALTQLAGEMANNGKLCVLGDFNLSALEAGPGMGKQMAALIYPLQTTIFGKRFDEIWLDKNGFTAGSTPRYLLYSGVLQIDEIHYRDSNRTMVTRQMEQEFKNEVSDHLPVWAAFRAVQ
ncbi:hypothetical protein BBJ28_00009431 [Nothophytophthora sp. Chile5]|nr:hypothetical protein BBJ28_00009431 [Nothophytophthora sp. Chile5]